MHYKRRPKIWIEYQIMVIREKDESWPHCAVNASHLPVKSVTWWFGQIVTQWHPAASVLEFFFLGWLLLWSEAVVQSTEVWKVAVAECFGSFLLLVSPPNPFILQFVDLCESCLKSLCSAGLSSLYKLNLNWKNVCLTSWLANLKNTPKQCCCRGW